jgi:hypothetical protein
MITNAMKHIMNAPSPPMAKLASALLNSGLSIFRRSNRNCGMKPRKKIIAARIADTFKTRFNKTFSLPLIKLNFDVMSISRTNYISNKIITELERLRERLLLQPTQK